MLTTSCEFVFQHKEVWRDIVASVPRVGERVTFGVPGREYEVVDVLHHLREDEASDIQRVTVTVT